jgi:hypothetical protein
MFSVWKGQIWRFDGQIDICYTVRLLKLEYYLLFFSNFKMRQLFTKFRVSGHSLEIESGRYKNITREERICKKCNLNEIGDE